MSAEPEVAEVQVVPFARRKSRVKKGEGLWLMSFSDMSLILMSFFVLQLSFSTPDKRKYDNLSSAIKEQQQAHAAAQARQDNLSTLSEKVRQVIKQKQLESVAEVSLGVDGLAVEFKDQTLFAPGSAAPNPAYAKTVDQVLAVIANSPGEYKLVIEGHTDDVPIAGRYGSNWELSAARGIALLNAFHARGVNEKRMAVEAFAHTRPKVSVKGLVGDELRKARAANRRVVIRLQ
jgi:chemotaxis protein MotB